ncbi:histone-lysine N-methyltransferase PRDM9-like [Anopheles merus]|uniref:histone-lysine N-methyltransferase PRDM9-like n=1 Tax=Anopheles merus TaxID=30066 RepID=UPI001BE402FD|nr:histone-lysine N-methyltransferase PRDM9-like [Anopheles merus]
MKCFVSGCDTDDNVVSYTSVFYVNCPTDSTIQQQWFTLLEVTDPDAMRALVDGRSKVCSCHFTEDCFGHHPVYGYRYYSPRGTERKRTGIPEQRNRDNTDADQEKSLHDLNENLQQLDKFVSQQDVGDADEYDEYEMDVSDQETERFAGKQVHLGTVEERSNTDVIEVKDDTEVDVVKEEYEVTSSKDTASDSETDYGPIEALEEVSVCGDKVRVRDENEGLNRFFCEYCGRGFRFKSLKDRHTLVHTKMKKFCCEVCGRGFTQKINLTIHLRTHTGESGNKKFTCQICEKKCIRMSELEAHMTAHLRKFPHVCPLCQERYSDATGLYDHFQVEHRSEMTLRELIDLLSENENAIVISDKEAPSKHSAGRWIVRVSRVQQDVPHGGQPRAAQALLHKHLPSHTLEKPYQCPHCALSYTQRVNLRVHMERKHAQQLKQPKKEPMAASEPSFVVATLNADGDVVESIETAARITGPRTHDCGECGKKFPRRASLLQHVAATKRCTTRPRLTVRCAVFPWPLA